jgi:hypothetical protein
MRVELLSEGYIPTAWKGNESRWFVVENTWINGTSRDPVEKEIVRLESYKGGVSMWRTGNECEDLVDENLKRYKFLAEIHW